MKKILFFLFLFLLLLIGCSKKNDTIKIGIVLPLSGELSNFGKNVLNGIELAVEDYNANTNAIIVQLVVEDSKANPTVAVSALNKLVDIDQAGIVIGDLTSSATLAMVPIAQKNKLILLSPTASNPSLSNSSEYFFRVWPSDNYSGMVAANYSYVKLGKRKAAIIYINNDYGLGLKNVFYSTFEKLGGNILLVEAYTQERTDFKNILAKAKKANVDLIYIPGHPYGIASVAKQSIEIGLKTTLFSDVAAEDKEFIPLAGSAAKGLFFVTPAFDVDSKDTIIAHMVNSYKKKYSELPDIHAVKGYDAATVLLQGIQKSITNSEDMIKFLRNGTFHCVSGELVFDKNGDVHTAMAIKQFDNSLQIRILLNYSIK